MGSLGLIAAAGKATRFNGILKELLPVEGGTSLLERHILQMYGIADQIVVVSSLSKMAAHAAVTEKYSKVTLTLQRRSWDIYGAMYAGMWIPHDRVYFAMADTFIPPDGFNGGLGEKCPFWMGMHWTNRPARFGVLYRGLISNKNPEFGTEPQRRAWGVLSWDRTITARWFKEGGQTYTDAINLALKEFPTNFYDLDYYHDMASWEDYWSLLDETRHGEGRDKDDRKVLGSTASVDQHKHSRTRSRPKYRVVRSEGRLPPVV